MSGPSDQIVVPFLNSTRFRSPRCFRPISRSEPADGFLQGSDAETGHCHSPPDEDMAMNMMMVSEPHAHAARGHGT
ncbi:MAG: hypothetical protein ACK50J_30555, partial [Planctomyces sp.]